MATFPLACADRLESIGLLVKARRLERKIRQKDLAALTGLSTTTLGKIEAGTPTVEMRGYMTVLWHLGLLDEVFQEPRVPTPPPYATEHRVRLRKLPEDDF
ncbi:transcriptional regulator, XRE family [Azotobacter vinelandii CA]|uniref:Transcriptional regulator, XRE family n=2 Tax=Azotobacter vinelandii TaxID=354 RepID=C1DI96_AZOVD|nr:helix-turn-helix domain-containing protein [Azotobacter vinelandii]ACO76593.1 transcriptional regulator, XRE family [Azotobacter vinelandii DJ]AGK17349.1 transcriptional regulator, XRE family [Azotobacter vinelandii CA]AGK19221.1 transcriptional regulator, XRE family [Azotobacter vinelandii CA6]WKN22354.1 helix-turn-helix domain-containing protein [Azotobacter vinelandii]SFX11666.1 Helix-turn-helix [Azotobacter vinelandii]